MRSDITRTGFNQSKLAAKVQSKVLRKRQRGEVLGKATSNPWTPPGGLTMTQRPLDVEAQPRRTAHLDMRDTVLQILRPHRHEPMSTVEALQMGLGTDTDTG